MPERICDRCETPYWQKRRDQLFCGPTCRDIVRRAKYRARPEYLERRREHYRINAERIRQRAYAWAKANQEKTKAAAAKWRAANPDAHSALRAAYRAANAEHRNAVTRAWNRENRHRKRANAARRRALKAGAAGDATLEQILARVAYYGGRCWMCGDDYSHVDHVKPLSKGGSNWPANLRPACKPCNLRKSDQWPYREQPGAGNIPRP